MKVLLFGGTTEGRVLSAVLADAGTDVTLSVATDFGREAASKTGVTVLTGRLDEGEIRDLIRQSGFDMVVDATHPYATAVTRNVRAACEAQGVSYLRLKRPESDALSDVDYAQDVADAARKLQGTGETILLTTGSKELEPFARLDHFQERVYLRILPMPDALNKALGLGFPGSHIICMQGPFDTEINTALLKMTGANRLVTKESGEAGGFDEKVSAALALGCKVTVIARPVREEGYTLEEMLVLFRTKNAYGGGSDPGRYNAIDREDRPGAGEKRAQAGTPEEKRAFFPLFVDLSGRKVLVIGGGAIAQRRVEALEAFGADVTVLSPEINAAIRDMAARGSVRLLEKPYQTGDIAGIMPFFIVAATGDRQANHDAMNEAAAFAIPASVADKREECTCYFPAIAQSESFIAGLVSKDGDHAGVRAMAEKLRRLLVP